MSELYPPITEIDRNTVQLQWLEHRWPVYHGCFELVVESLDFFSITADIEIFGIIRELLFYFENVCCVYSLESPRLGDSNKYT